MPFLQQMSAKGITLEPGWQTTSMIILVCIVIVFAIVVFSYILFDSIKHKNKKDKTE